MHTLLYVCCVRAARLVSLPTEMRASTRLRCHIIALHIHQLESYLYESDQFESVLNVWAEDHAESLDWRSAAAAIAAGDELPIELGKAQSDFAEMLEGQLSGVLAEKGVSVPDFYAGMADYLSDTEQAGLVQVLLASEDPATFIEYMRSVLGL